MAFPTEAQDWVKITINKTKVGASFANFPYMLDLSAHLSGNVKFKSFIATSANIAVYCPTSDSIRPRIVTLDLSTNYLLVTFDAATSTSVDAVFYICVGSGFSQTDSSTALSLSGYTGYWGLNNKSNDATTPDSVGGLTLTRAFSASLSHAGKFGNCALLPNVNGSAYSSATGNGGIGSGDATIEFMIKHITFNATGGITFDSKFMIMFYVGLIDVYQNGIYSLRYTANLNPGEWYHVMVTRPGAIGEKPVLYINGAPITTASLNYATGLGTTFTIGRGSNQQLNAYLDEVSVIPSLKPSTFITTRYNMFFDNGFWAVVPKPDDGGYTSSMRLLIDFGL